MKFYSKQEDGKSLGSLPSLPIRRFAPRERLLDGRIKIFTGIKPDPENGWEIFEKALHEIESPDGSSRS